MIVFNLTTATLCVRLSGLICCVVVFNLTTATLCVRLAGLICCVFVQPAAKSDKAKLISRMAKMGQPMLPVMNQSPADAAAETEVH